MARIREEREREVQPCFPPGPRAAPRCRLGCAPMVEPHRDEMPWRVPGPWSATSRRGEEPEAQGQGDSERDRGDRGRRGRRGRVIEPREDRPRQQARPRDRHDQGGQEIAKGEAQRQSSRQTIIVSSTSCNARRPRHEHSPDSSDQRPDVRQMWADDVHVALAASSPGSSSNQGQRRAWVT